MIITYKKGVVLFLKILFILIWLFCFYCIFSYPIAGEYLLTFPLILSCIYGWIYLYYFKIEITDDFVRQHGVKKKSIGFDNVEKTEIYTNQLIIKSLSTTIKITSDLEKQAEAISFILERLKERSKNKE